ncbi:class I SAM-dependent methyltransferase [Brevundimonas sp.]|uniref:class I SAM-dependent DNA methyltransferase n=1 Tax=Brevundimonas sp. TaxID=1871086 RepID=UPI0027379326|nr:class I SAM-dependent methyltransferase [Brevundimonas sp.]MDP3802871.1 class I SAM-dependent methyltransferase [Brevundimonas sp.]
MGGPAEAVIDLYSRRAMDWDADRGRSLIERAWLDGFLARVPANGHVLDLGCGSGEPIAGYLIRRGRRVTGVDAARGLIVLCRARFPEQDWRVADMRGLDLGRVFDGVIAWHSAFHLTPADQRAMFAVYTRHVAPGGVLMFTSGSTADESVGEWRGEPLYHGSLSPEAYREGLDEAGFDLVTHRIEDPDCGGATVWLSRRRVRE